MAMNDENADHARTMLPWVAGQASLDTLIAVAEDRFLTFEVVVPSFSRGALGKAFVGRRHVGFVDPDSLDFHRWPSVVTEFTMDAYLAVLHADADSYSRPAICYFVGGDSGPVKIGFTVDLKGRLAALRSCSPIRLNVLATATGGPVREAAYHQQFADARLHGEWFTRTPEIEAEIARLNERRDAA